MKFSTKLKKIHSIENLKVKKLALLNLAFKCMPGSLQQKQVNEQIKILN